MSSAIFEWFMQHVICYISMQDDHRTLVKFYVDNGDQLQGCQIAIPQGE